tara:strand:- start:53 stop:448 length:396 start_codon:yes stop_codon:yes gene_type:complete
MGDDDKWDGSISISASSDYTGGLDYDNSIGDVTFTYDTSPSTSTMSTSTVTVPGIGSHNITMDSGAGAYTFDLGDHCVDLNTLDEDEIKEMCKEYPALQIVWQNFKTMYDLVKQDYKGKKEAGEIEDELPF